MNKRRWLLWILIAAFVWLVVTRLGEIENLAETLSRGVWLWVLVAALFQLGHRVLLSKVYQVAFNLTGVKSSTLALVPVLLGSMFVNAVAPSGGAAGMALFVDDAVQRGQSAARATAGVLLGLIAVYSGFGLLLLLSLAILYISESLQFYHVLVALALLLLTLLLGGLLFLGWRRPTLLEGVLARVQRAVDAVANRLRRTALLGPGWVARTTTEFTTAATAIGRRPSHLPALLLWSVAAHLANAVCFYAMFLAFRHPVGAGPLLAGFAIGHLFVIMAPTPQGVGFVETIVPYVFSSFGVPTAEATVVVLAYRGLSFWLPLGAGFFLLQRLKSLGAEEQALTELWSVRIVALLTGLAGVVNVLSALTPDFIQDLQSLTPYPLLGARVGSHLGTALSGFALLLLASALWRRKRVAWYLTLMALAISAAINVYRWSILDLRTLLTGVLAVWLLFLRPHFHARSDPPSVRQGVRVAAAALAFTVLYGSFGLLAMASTDGRALDPLQAVGQALVMLLLLRPPSWLGAVEAGSLFAFTFYAAFGLSVLYALFLLVRPVLVRRGATRGERERAREIVARHGRAPLARLALQPGKSYFFGPKDCVVAYQVEGRVAVALGDPIGPADGLPDAIEAFAQHCAHNDWLSAFYHVRAANEAHYRAAGYDSLAVAREAVVAVDSDNALPEPVLQQAERLRRQGHRATCLAPPQEEEMVSTLRAVSDEWLTMQHAVESGFSLSWFDADVVRQAPVVAAYTPSGLLSAFATIVFDREGGQATVDLLRHRPQPAAGTLELLLSAVIRWAQAEGFTSVNLGISYVDVPADPATAQMLRYVYRSAAFSVGPVQEVKAKFEPEWVPRYLVYPGAASLPAVWTAVIRVSSTGSWPWPFLKRRFRLYNGG